MHVRVPLPVHLWDKAGGKSRCWQGRHCWGRGVEDIAAGQGAVTSTGPLDLCKWAGVQPGWVGGLGGVGKVGHLQMLLLWGLAQG